MVPKDIQRREKTGPSKLVTELRLYKSLYEDWQMRQDLALDDAEKEGVPMSEIGEYSSTNTRTLSRYLHELTLCGAVEAASIRKNGTCCRAEFGIQNPMQESSFGATAHLLRLSRTTLLMRERLNWRNLPSKEDYPHAYVQVFFDSLQDTKDWYFAVYSDEIPLRTIQRDMQAVWEALGNNM